MTWSASLHRRRTGRNLRNRPEFGGVLPLQQIFLRFTLADQPGSDIFIGRATLSVFRHYR